MTAEEPDVRSAYCIEFRKTELYGFIYNTWQYLADRPERPQPWWVQPMALNPMQDRDWALRRPGLDGLWVMSDGDYRRWMREC